MTILTKRQSKILGFIKQKGAVSNSEIVIFLKRIREETSRITVVRELDELIKNNFITKIGMGRSIKYQEKIKNKLLVYYDINKYFKKGPDERQIAYDRFNFEIFKNFINILSKEEIIDLYKTNQIYLTKIKKLSPVLMKKEFERLKIELSWKSSKIEGNTYSLLDTEILIKEGKEAKGHKKEEVIMILNHKKALDYIFNNKYDYKKINLRKIEDIHRLLTSGLGVKIGIRKGIVGIVGTKYKPLDNQFQIKEVMEKMIKTVNKFKDPFSKALIVILMISYIQPFEDGNKRTARLLGNAILLAYNVCPLSYRSINESNYKKALVVFYEQNSARYFKELFIDQCNFAVRSYF